MKYTNGIDHVGLTVKDVNASAKFFIDVLGFSKLGERPDYPAIFITDGAIRVTLWQVRIPDEALPFDRHQNIGLHHLAFKVESDEALDLLCRKLKTVATVKIEFEPELVGRGPSRHMMISDPGGLRIEFIFRQ